MKNSLKQTKDLKLNLLSIQKNKLHLGRISLINSIKLWIILHLKQFPAINYEPCELSSLINNSKDCLSFFHLNISSLSFYIEELTTLISEPNLTFDIFRVSETKLRLTKAPLNSVKLPAHNFEFTATECSNGGTAIYILEKFELQI